MWVCKVDRNLTDDRYRASSRLNEVPSSSNPASPFFVPGFGDDPAVKFGQPNWPRTYGVSASFRF